MKSFDEIFDKASGYIKKHAGLVCPTCQSTLDAYTNIKLEPGVKPKAGSISICWYCGNVQVYAGRPLTLRNPTDKEAAELAKHVELQRMIRMVKIDRALNPKYRKHLH